MQIATADAELGVVLGEVLGHALGQRGDEHPLFVVDPLSNLVEQIVDLTGDGAHFDDRVHEPGRADDLFDDDTLGVLELVRAGCRRDVNRLADPLFELGEVERPVVERRRHTKPVLHECFFPRAVAVVHAPDLRHRLM